MRCSQIVAAPVEEIAAVKGLPWNDEMHLLYTDETNIDPSTTDFFVYAGVAIPCESAGNLSKRIDALRAARGYGADDILKFNTVERPAHITPDAHREAKKQLLEEAAAHGVRMFSSFILHKVASSPSEARFNEINRISLHFDYYLKRIDDYGLVLIDSFQDTSVVGFLRRKFSTGLKGLPYSGSYRLDRVLGFHVASIGQSNFCSVVDVVLGALRYSVNARGNARQQGVASTLLGQLAPMVLRTSSGEVDELSIFFSPKTIRAPSYLKEYQALHAFLAVNGLACQQEPSGS